MMKKYETYKETGVVGLEQIPSNWKMEKIKYQCKVTDGTHFSPQTQPQGKPYVTVSNVFNDSIDIAGAQLISEEDFELLVKQGCKPQTGDVLLAKDGTVGRSAIVGTDNDFVCLSSLGILTPNKELLSSFLKYSLDSHFLQDQMKLAMAGSALRRITISKIEEFSLPIPSTMAEQKAIVNYLNDKVGSIDNSMAAIDAQIKDLISYRQSFISETVTKGLNPNVQMKESGIDWVGSIPNTWKTTKLKYIAQITLGKMLEDKEPLDNNGEYSLEYYLKARNIKMFEVLTDKDQVDKMWFNKKEKLLYELKDGNVVMNEGGDIGKVSVWKDCGYKCYIQNSVHKLTPNEGVSPAFLQYFISHATASGYFSKIASAISIAHLTKEKLAITPIVLPPYEEQVYIASYINEKRDKIEAAIKALADQKEDLASLKQSIISEAVTGKIDVRDWSPNNEQ